MESMQEMDVEDDVQAMDVEDDVQVMDVAEVRIENYMPPIFWHDRKQIMCVDVQQSSPADQFSTDESASALLSYKICTASVQFEVRVWELNFFESKQEEHLGKLELGVNFIANLVGHSATLNFAKYSPDGKIIASGDVNGFLFIWKVFPRDETYVATPDKPLSDETALFEIPPNKENWARALTPICHDGDLNTAAFSPNSMFIVSAGKDEVKVNRTDNGKQVWSHRAINGMITGTAWDPDDRYIVTLTTNRRLDLFTAHKGHLVLTLNGVYMPEVVIAGKLFEEGATRVFYDQHVVTLHREPDFSPCGQLFFAAAAELESGEFQQYGVHVFQRHNFHSARPFAMFPSSDPTFVVRCCPVKYALREDVDENWSELPYRYIFAAMCSTRIFFYDTQCANQIGEVSDLSYDDFTSISWGPDGRMLAISSMEGFNFFLRIHTDSLERSNLTIERCSSPLPKRILADEQGIISSRAKPKAANTPAAAVSQSDENVTPSSTADPETTPKARKPRRKIPLTSIPADPPAGASTAQQPAASSQADCASPSVSTPTPKASTPSTPKSLPPGQTRLDVLFKQQTPKRSPSTLAPLSQSKGSQSSGEVEIIETLERSRIDS